MRKLNHLRICIKECKKLNQTFVTILILISIVCMFNFIHTFGPMGIPLCSAATAKEKKKKKHGLVNTYELHKKIKIMAPNV